MRSEFCPSGWREWLVLDHLWGCRLRSLWEMTHSHALRAFQISVLFLCQALQCLVLCAVSSSSWPLWTPALSPQLRGTWELLLDYPFLSYGLALSPGSELGLLLVSPPLREHCPLMANAHCLENHCFIYIHK